MSFTSIVSPEDQRVTFVELFFDLVFVFAVTQIVNLLHDGVGWGAAAEALLVFWLVWWGWTQFTWALNAADTTHHLVALGTLVATAVAFFMAVAVPDAFHGGAAWFAIPYVLVRMIGLGLYGWVAAVADPSQYAAVCTFALVSLGGLAAVLVGGFAGGSTQYWLWGLAIVLDVIAAAVGARSEAWNLHPEHFAERHGLFVIIALGESLIVAAGGVTEGPWTDDLIVVAILAVALTCALWWTYFSGAKAELDHALASVRGDVQSIMASQVFSLAHFPMLCGVIACAVAIEAAVAQPAAPLALGARLALALGVALFVGGMVVAVWRATRRVLLSRLLIVAATTVAIAVAVAAPVLSLGIAFCGVAAVAAWEQWRGPAAGGALAPRTVA
ncbi:MAG: low temperature requirement protein A [Longimicrobiales bacterium]